MIFYTILMLMTLSCWRTVKTTIHTSQCKNVPIPFIRFKSIRKIQGSVSFQVFQVFVIIVHGPLSQFCVTTETWSEERQKNGSVERMGCSVRGEVEHNEIDTDEHGVPGNIVEFVFRQLPGLGHVRRLCRVHCSSTSIAKRTTTLKQKTIKGFLGKTP